MSFATNAVVSKAKSMYGGRLSKEDYDELLRRKSVADITFYLKHQTAYSEVLSDVHEATIHRGQLENLLHRHVFDKGMRLVHFAGNENRNFYRCDVITKEIDFILERVRMLNSELYEGFLSDVPMYLNQYTSFELADLEKVHTFGELLQLLRKTPYYNLLAPFQPQKGEAIDYTSCEHVLQSYYFDHLREVINQSFKSKTRKQLLTIVDTQIELMNITKIYRYRKFFQEDLDVIRGSLMKCSRMSEQFLEQLMAAPTMDAFKRLLADGPFHLYMDDSDFVFIKYYADTIRYNACRRYMRFSNEAPLVYYTFIALLQFEVENLINIIEGIRYGVPPENIEKMLIY